MHVPYGMQPHYPHQQQPQQPQQQPWQQQQQQQQPHYQQAPQQQQYQQHQPQYPQQQQPPPSHAPSPWGAVQMPRMPQMPAAFGAFGASIKTPAVGGLPAPLAFGLGIVAVAVALVFDVVFLHVHIPGVGGYAWYLTTALSFMGAGYGSAMWTRAGKTTSMVAVGVAACLYGVADVGLGLVLESLTLGGAIMLGAQGVAIGFVTGFGGVYKALRARNDD